MATRTIAAPALEPLPGFAALDGCHCISSSLARIFHHAGHALSEEMILGLGAGMGFVYWRMKFGSQDSVFVGGRANLKNFYQDLGKRTGVVIREKQTSSAAKAKTELLKTLQAKASCDARWRHGYAALV
jgi:2-keto-3-deoxy-galactonokinase